MKILGIHHDSVVDGPGIRDVIFFAGCEHHCKACFSPESWYRDKGYDLSVADIFNELDTRNDVTISGGDPFHRANRKDLADLVSFLKDVGKNIWVYTGYTYEELLEEAKNGDIDILHALIYIDVLVDGEFEIDKKDLALKYRGSSNQRLIDVQKTIDQEKIVELHLM